jgi:hypothetical protein
MELVMLGHHLEQTDFRLQWTVVNGYPDVDSFPNKVEVGIAGGKSVT